MKRGVAVDIKMLYLFGLLLFFSFALVFVFLKANSAFVQENEQEGIGTRQTALLHAIGLAEGMLLYIDTGAVFAAREAIALTAREGAIPHERPCGTYAGMPLWTAPGMDCIPTEQEIKESFLEAMAAALPRHLAFPGMPYIDYRLRIEEGFRIVAITQDRILIPIVAAKDGTQQEIEQMLLAGGIGAKKEVFARDTALAAQVMRASYGAPRSAGIETVNIGLTRTLTAQEAIAKYRAGSAGAHYLIDEIGGIVQLMPEQELVEGTESIVVMLVNKGEVECGEDIAPCPSCGSACWNPIREEQRESLELLLGDLLRRRNVPAGNITATSAPLVEETLPGVLAGAIEESARIPSGQDSVLRTGPVQAALPQRLEVLACPASTFVSGEQVRLDGIRIDLENVVAFVEGTVHSVCPPAVLRCDGYDNAGQGGSVVLRHETPQGTLFTRYSGLDEILLPGATPEEARGRFVARGETIGTAREAVFRTYLGAGELFAGEGTNPLCLLPESELRNLEGAGEGCADFLHDKKFSRESVGLQEECRGIAPLSPVPPCGVTLSGLDTITTIDSTLQRIRALPGRSGSLEDELGLAAQRHGVDPRLLAAQIHAESRGNPKAVSYADAAGISQFVPATARQYFKEVPLTSGALANIALIDDCNCKEDDPRFDPVASVWAQAKYLGYLTQRYAKYTDGTALAVAAYNAGEGNVDRAIRGSSPDPSWSEVRPLLPRPQETGPYVESILAIFSASGGSVGLHEDRSCGGTTIRSFGEYSFNPSFSLSLPDPFGPYDAIASWAKETVRVCDGSGSKSNIACLEERKGSFRSLGAGVVACPGPDAFLSSFRQAVEDCISNGQEGCTCAWSPPRIEDAVSMKIDLYGTSPHLFVDNEPANAKPASLHSAKYRLSPQSALEEVPLRLRMVQQDGKYRMDYQRLRQGLSGDGTIPQGGVQQVEGFTMMKEEGDLVWIAHPGDAPACGPYKTRHQVCFAINDLTLTREGREKPLVRLALYLEDPYAPPAPAKICAMNVSTEILYSFRQPDAQDMSYYEVRCTGAREGEAVRMLAKDEVESGRLSILDDCGGFAEEYLITITPFDTSGNEGEAIEKTIPDESFSDIIVPGVSDLLECAAG